MTKRRKMDSLQVQECSNILSSSHDARAKDANESKDRKDSGIYSGVGPSISCDEEADESVDYLADLGLNSLEELSDVFEEEEEEEEVAVEELMSPLLTSSPIVGHDTLIPPPFNHRDGALSPNTYRRLRTISEGSNEEFEYEFLYGRLSNPEIRDAVVSMRLQVMTDQIDEHLARQRPITAAGVLDDEAELVDEVVSLLFRIAHIINSSYLSPSPLLLTPRRILFGCATVAAITTVYNWFRRS